MPIVALSEREFALRDDFREYRNEFGLVDDSTALYGAHSGNSTLYHSHYLWCLKLLGYYDIIDALMFSRAIDSGFENGRGNYRRAPAGTSFSTDQEGPDDFIGLASLSALDSKIPFARDIFDHAQTKVRLDSGFPAHVKKPLWAKLFGWVRVRYVFNSNFPGSLLSEDGQRFDIRPWLGRFPQFRAHVIYSLQRKPGFLLRLTWAVSIWQTARISDKHGTDQWVLSSYLTFSYLRSGHRSKLNDLAVSNFKKRFYKKWPGGLASIFIPYFGEKHPLARYFPHDVFST